MCYEAIIGTCNSVNENVTRNIADYYTKFK